jgi:hypothetical protein
MSGLPINYSDSLMKMKFLKKKKNCLAQLLIFVETLIVVMFNALMKPIC